ncbi:MAG: beta-galactosidase, partial [Clostridium sp.]
MARAELSWLEDPEVFRVNRLDAHSDHRFYSTEADMEAKNETLLQSLNGQWDFSWSRCPSERPADFHKEDYDLSGFKTIEVPGHMELQG